MGNKINEKKTGKKVTKRGETFAKQKVKKTSKKSKRGPKFDKN